MTDFHTPEEFNKFPWSEVQPEGWSQGKWRPVDLNGGENVFDDFSEPPRWGIRIHYENREEVWEFPRSLSLVFENYKIHYYMKGQKNKEEEIRGIFQPLLQFLGIEES